MRLRNIAFASLLLAGLIRAGEAQPPEGQRPADGMSAEQLIRQFDRNGDGKISRDEAPERMKQRWDQLDTDHDGYIALEELKARDARVRRMDNQAERPQSGAGKRDETSGPVQPSSKFSVITVGTGTPRYDAARAGPCSAIQYQGRYILMDMGNGTQARLSEAGISNRLIDGLLLTHHHLDHNEEFVPLFMGTRLMGGKPEIVGPPHTQDLVDFITKFYAEDISYRLARRGRAANDFPAARVREIKGGESFELGALKVTTTRVNHAIHTVAYRFDVDGHSIVISGDLSYTEGLIELARNADVLVIDSGGAIVRKNAAGEEFGGGGGMGGRPGGGGGGAAGDARNAHGTMQDVCAMAQKSGAKRLVLTHIAGEVDEAATIRAVGELYKGEVIVGQDLLEVSPTAGVKRPHVMSSGAGHARVFVNAAVAGAKHDGQSWATAFSALQEGIAAAEKQGGGEVWVAKGTYKPTSGTDRDASIQLRKGVAVYGGFAATETERDQRAWERNATVLSGDIGKEGVETDNSCHVVKGADDAVLDGFTVSGGYAMNAGPPSGLGQPGAPRPQGGPPAAPIHITPEIIMSGGSRGSGAGMLNFQCAPTVRNCIFRDNSAGKGGAMYNMVGRGGPPASRGSSAPAPSLGNCQFINNHARGRGGAIANDLGTHPTLRNCAFVGNSCSAKGGALYNDFGCSPTLANCLFAENRAVSAAAIGNDGGSSPLIVHCTFTRNVAGEEGAALYQGTGPANNPIVVGCIFWDDHCDNGPAEIFNWHDNDPQVTASCVQGGCPGDGNFDKDPLFTDVAGHDYTLKPGSPCKEVGHSAATGDEQFARPATPPPMIPERRTETRARVPVQQPARVIYVNAAAAGPHDGKSWNSAHASLEAALAAAEAPAEIWVAAGTYKPANGTDRSAAFRLTEGVAVLGGFRGNETQCADRDWKANASVLSGDIGRAGDDTDNSYHVVIGANGAVLDGCAIRDGNANGRTYDGKGGGMVNYLRAAQTGPMGQATGVSPIVRNCLFTRNRAVEGGAVYNYDRGAPEFSKCRFVGNAAEYGGAMVDRGGVRSVLQGCEFEKNTARWRAGALYLDYGSRPNLTDCRFVGNRSECHGGALAMISRASQLENTVPVLKNCSFTGNTAKRRGGAIANFDNCILGLDSCAFSENCAAAGGAIANHDSTRAVVINCQFAGNRSEHGDTDIATDESSSVSRNRADWPDQTSRARPGGFVPPP